MRVGLIISELLAEQKFRNNFVLKLPWFSGLLSLVLLALDFVQSIQIIFILFFYFF